MKTAVAVTWFIGSNFMDTPYKEYYDKHKDGLIAKWKKYRKENDLVD